MKTPLFSQSSLGAAVSIWVEVRKGVLAGIDVLTARETFEDLGAAVAHTSRLDVEQIAAVGLQRVADVAEGGAVRQDRLPVGTGTREQLPVHLRTRECPTGQGHDAPVALGDVAEGQRLAEGGGQTVGPVRVRARRAVVHGASR